MWHIGIDPGVSGGIAVLQDDGQLIGVWPMPKTDRDIYELIMEHATGSKAVLETVHSMPGQGVKSMFTFGASYGGLRMALTACGSPWREVRPREWQQDLGIGGKLDDRKNKHKALAQQLFPKANITHATADALLLAEWLRRQP